MGVSVVNGYLCLCSCDVAKAKKGEDPHPALHADAAGKDAQMTRRDDPAVVFGGALAASRDVDRVNSASPDQPADAAANERSFAVDLLA
jgi:hypothetical protein